MHTAAALLVLAITVISKPFNIIGYWGQNRSGSLNPDRLPERSLLETCANYDTINVAYLRELVSFDGLPGLSLSDHCRRIHPAVTPTTAAGFKLLHCPEVGKEIQLCQRTGVKVNLSISPFKPIPNGAQAREIANTVFSLFLGGRSDIERPFGDAVFDGVDLLVRNNDHVGYVEFVDELRRLSVESGKPLSISVSTRCDFPDNQFGPELKGRILTEIPRKVDSLNVFMTSSPTCSATLNPSGFRTQTDRWVAYAQQSGLAINLGLPSIGSAREPFVDAAVGDQPPASMIPEIVRKVDGVALFDTSFDNAEETCLCQHKVSEVVAETVITTCERRTYAELFSGVADDSDERMITDLVTQRGNVTFADCSQEKEGGGPTIGSEQSDGESAQNGGSTAPSGATIDFGGRYMSLYTSPTPPNTIGRSLIMCSLVLLLVITA